MSSLSKIGEKFKLILISIGLLYIFIENSFAKEIKQQELLVSNNGNFLFYNSPVAVQMNGHTFIAFITSEGKVTVNELSVDKVINSFFVHDYSLNMNKKIGFANNDHHSTDGSIIQAQYFMNNIFNFGNIHDK